MVDGFEVDLGGMNTLTGSLDQAAKNITGATDALKGTSASDLGGDDLDSVGADFQDRWTYGTGKISELTGQMVHGLRTCIQVYQKAEDANAKIFAMLTRKMKPTPPTTTPPKTTAQPGPGKQAPVPDPATTSPGVTGQRISDLALQNLGKKASDTNSLGTKGYYGSGTGDHGGPEFWCADFVKWTWAHAGVTDLGGLTAGAASFYQYGKKHGTLSNTPHVGDAVVFSGNKGDPGNVHHVAIVSKVKPDGTIETVNGDFDGKGPADTAHEQRFAGTSSVVRKNSQGAVGSKADGMYIAGYVSPAH